MIVNRRTFSTLVASAIALPRVAFAQAKTNCAFYSGVGGQLTHFEVDFDAATLAKRRGYHAPRRDSVCLAASVPKAFICGDKLRRRWDRARARISARPALSGCIPRHAIGRAVASRRSDQVETAAGPCQRR